MSETLQTHYAHVTDQALVYPGAYPGRSFVVSTCLVTNTTATAADAGLYVITDAGLPGVVNRLVWKGNVAAHSSVPCLAGLVLPEGYILQAVQSVPGAELDVTVCGVDTATSE